MIEFTRKRIADRILFGKPFKRLAVFLRLLGQEARDDQQEAGDGKAEQQGDHRKRRQRIVADCLDDDPHFPSCEVDFALDIRAISDPALALRNKEAALVAHIEQSDRRFLDRHQFRSRGQKLLRVERAVDEAFQAAVTDTALENRHVDEEARPLFSAFLQEGYAPGSRRPPGPRCLVQRLAAYRFGIHVETDCPPVAQGIGLQEHDRDQLLSRFTDGAWRDPDRIQLAFVQYGFGRCYFPGSDCRGPTDPLGAAIIGIEPELGHELPEGLRVDLLLRTEQGACCPEECGVGVAPPFDRKGHCLCFPVQVGLFANALSAFDREHT